MTEARRPPTDWEAIEREFRAGQLSVREIGKLYGVSHTAIQKRAKAHEWVQNLTERVKEAVATKLVASEVATATNAKQAVEEAAARVVQVIREHRTSIGRGQKITNALFGELEGADIPLKDKSVVLGNLSGALKTLVGLERQAFNLGDDQPAGDGAQVTRIERVVVDPPNSDS